MLFRSRRRISLTLTLAAALGIGLAMARSICADGMLFQHTIPREVDAYNFRTGGPYMAPPVPYGHYAKDYVDEMHKGLGCVTCQLHGLMGGHGCGHGGCGKGGECGHGDCSAHGGGFGHGGGWGQENAAEISGGSAIAAGAGYGVSGPLGSTPSGNSSVLGGYDPAGLGSVGYANTLTEAGGQATSLPSVQSPCGQAGCQIAAKHGHLSAMVNKIRCGACGGMGCGACANTGVTGLCGDPGCSLGAGHSHENGFGNGHGTGGGCSFCGGTGCSHCLAGLGSGLHGKLASLTGMFHKPKISWFNGAGGPVPLTPGYVPYIVTTRSPRDFFAFPPMNPNDP